MVKTNKLQMMPEMQTLSKPAFKSKSTETSDFRKLMEQRQQGAQGDSPAKENGQPAVADKEPIRQEGTQQEPELGVVSQEQIVWAAMAVMQAPVVPMQPEDKDLSAVTPILQENLVPVNSVNVERTPEAQTTAQPGALEPEAPADVLPQAREAQPAIQAEAGRAPELPTQTTRAIYREVPTFEGEDQETKAEVEVAADQPQTIFRDLESMPVKVGEVPVTKESGLTEGVEQQVAKQLTKALENGETKVEIRLTPERLGSVKVELTRNAEGEIRVVLSAENLQTRGLLEKHAADLQNLLHNQRQETVQVEVQHQQESQQGDSQYERGGRQNEQHQQRHQHQQHSDQDFLQQLRLGLIPLENEAS